MVFLKVDFGFFTLGFWGYMDSGTCTGLGYGFYIGHFLWIGRGRFSSGGRDGYIIWNDTGNMVWME
jgi:hypothetical protein